MSASSRAGLEGKTRKRRHEELAWVKQWFWILQIYNDQSRRKIMKFLYRYASGDVHENNKVPFQYVKTS